MENEMRWDGELAEHRKLLCFIILLICCWCCCCRLAMKRCWAARGGEQGVAAAAIFVLIEMVVYGYAQRFTMWYWVWDSYREERTLVVVVELNAIMENWRLLKTHSTDAHARYINIVVCESTSRSKAQSICAHKRKRVNGIFEQEICA